MTEPLLLDTHVWLWTMSNEPALKPSVRVLIEEAQRERRLFVPTFAFLEVAQKEHAGKLGIQDGLDNLIHRTLAPGKFMLAEVTLPVLVAAYRLPGAFHGDPADRIIVATAREGGYTLLTRDERILAYSTQGHVTALRA